MATFTGMIHEYVTPLPISFAKIEPDRLTIRYGAWTYEATSSDGFYYEGNYGKRDVDPDKVVQCWVYPGIDGSMVVYCSWHNRADVTAQGESVFRLVPSPTRPETDEFPEDWDRAKQALNAQMLLYPNVPLELVLVYDRWTGCQTHPAILDQAGLYVLFYGSGKIARVGQARRALWQRLGDYEPNTSGWFCFRWVGVIPVNDEHKLIITPLEDKLIATLRPPENTRGVDRREKEP